MKTLLATAMAAAVLSTATASLAGPPATRPFEEPTFVRRTPRSDGWGHVPRGTHRPGAMTPHANAGGGGHGPRTMHERAPGAQSCGCHC